MTELDRRLDINKISEAEKSIWSAMHEVESLLGCSRGVLHGDSRLFEAIDLMKKAKAKVGDYIDGIEQDQVAHD